MVGNMNKKNFSIGKCFTLTVTIVLFLSVFSPVITSEDRYVSSTVYPKLHSDLLKNIVEKLVEIFPRLTLIPWVSRLLDESNDDDPSQLCGPDMCIVKTVKLNGCGQYKDNITVDVGDWVTFRIQVTNTGTIPLDIIVKDLFPTNLTYDDNAKVNGIPEEPTLVDGYYCWYFNDTQPGETYTITFRATVLICGEHVNFVNVTGVYNGCREIYREDKATVTALCDGNPGIILQKTVNPEVIYPDNLVAYTYNIKNSGDTDLVNITLLDDQLGEITLPSTSLPAGDNMTITVDNVLIHDTTTNTAVVTGYTAEDEKVTDNATATVTVIHPGINVTKTATPMTVYLGDPVTWNITVENTGDILLHNVIVQDTNKGIIGSGVTLNAGEKIYFEYVTYPVENIMNIVTVEGLDPLCGSVSDTDYACVTVLVPCAYETWVDDSWHSQSDVNKFNPGLIWQYNAFNKIQEGVDAVCDCGVVHVRAGVYTEQVLINKNVSLLGDNAEILLPNILHGYTIDQSSETWTPIIFAYAGVLNNYDVTTKGHIGVTIDGFKINGRDKTDVIAILYHNVESGCTNAVISHNYITHVDIGIKIDGCTNDTTIIYNRIEWNKYDMNKTGILITESNECTPSNVEIHYNYIGIPCGLNNGIWNQVDNIVNATFNWWGADDGPSSLPPDENTDAITGRPADGFGDRAIGLIHFDPWWGVEASGILSKNTANVNEIIRFDASDSFAYDTTGDITSHIKYTWDFGDGIYSFSRVTSHLYTHAGTYKVKLKIEVTNYDLEKVYGFLRDFQEFTVTIT